MTDPDLSPKVPDLPPVKGTEAPDISPPSDPEDRDPAEGPTSGRQPSAAAESTMAGGQDEPPD